MDLDLQEISKPSDRSKIITQRTYCRPLLTEEGYEEWDDVIHRVIEHQRWLWERAKTHSEYPDIPLHDLSPNMREWISLTNSEEQELVQLWHLMYERKILPSGRTLWLGGTEVSKRREASQFNCAHTFVETVYDVVDCLWLLLQGTGVGFTPIVGTLTGFRKPIPEIEVIRSTRNDKNGHDNNEETFIDGVWTITVGDSAEAWAKSIGKLLAGKFNAKKIVLDFSQIRPGGERLRGYGWISSGDGPISRAYPAICEILNKRAGNLLRKQDIIEVMNWLGTVLSSRRSAEIALVEYGTAEWYEFAKFKENCFEEGFKHRQQSNNSLVFYKKPSKEDLRDVFNMMVESGGSEPGIINGEAATKKAPWFKGVNPCAEILLGNKSFCNLVEVDLNKFKGDAAGLHKAIELAARANYRQTIVDLRDGILQESWHLNNEFLRLCGVGLTGIVTREQDLTEYDWKDIRYSAVTSARSMAKELRMQHPKNVTTVKPSGTLSKVMDTTEGIHKPLGKYIFNWVNFSVNDEQVPLLEEAGYDTIPNPSDEEGVLVCLPISWEEVDFQEKTVERSDGTLETLHVNEESAIDQLERYKKVLNMYTDHNVSITVSYDPSEVEDIVNWIYNNWDSYVAVSFLFRADPTMSAKDLGFEYLPQEVVTKDRFDDYVSRITSIDNVVKSDEKLDLDECATGACPVI